MLWKTVYLAILLQSIFDDITTCNAELQPRYNDIWDDNKILGDVYNDILNDVIIKMYLNKKAKYCPYGYNQCEDVEVSDIIKKIINDAVAFEDLTRKSRMQTRYRNDKARNDGGNKFVGRTLHEGIIPRNKIVPQHMRDKMIYLLQLANVIPGGNNKKAQGMQLYAPAYKPFLVAERYRKNKLIKKPFDPFQVAGGK